MYCVPLAAAAFAPPKRNGKHQLIIKIRDYENIIFPARLGRRSAKASNEQRTATMQLQIALSSFRHILFPGPHPFRFALCEVCLLFIRANFVEKLKCISANTEQAHTKIMNERNWNGWVGLLMYSTAMRCMTIASVACVVVAFGAWIFGMARSRGTGKQQQQPNIHELRLKRNVTSLIASLTPSEQLSTRRCGLAPLCLCAMKLYRAACGNQRRPKFAVCNSR